MGDYSTGAFMEQEFPEVAKVIVEIYLDFSEESDKALKTLLSVAEELLDEHIWVDVIPHHVWFTDPLEAEVMDLPKIIINGKIRFIGRAPDRAEIISAIRERIGMPAIKSEEIEIETARYFDGGFREVAFASS
ncbi:MAG: thioredoxin family protein [Thermosphaera sp.]